MIISIVFLLTVLLYIIWDLWRCGTKSSLTSQIASFRYGSIPGFKSWIGAFRFLCDPPNFLLAGYELHKENIGPAGCFKFSDLYDEFVVICDKAKIEEYYAAPREILSSFDRNKENIQIEWIMGKEMVENPYPIRVIRSKATPLIVNYLESGQGEIQVTLDEIIGHQPDWKAITVYELSAILTARFSNFIFGGEELSRNAPYIELLSNYGRAFIVSIQILRLFPPQIKNLIKYFMPTYSRELRACTYLAPYFQKRLNETANLKQRDDFLQALINESLPHQRNVAHLVQSLFTIHAAVQFATTHLIANSIFILSNDPEQYVSILRTELREHLQGDKMGKSLLDKCVKLDSFLRECARLNDAFLLGAERLAIQDFTFSDGTFIPKGTTLGVPQIGLHLDPGRYPNPTSFDPWRYSRVRESKNGIEGGWSGPGMKLTDTNSSDYLYFGHGYYTCPGRHFATLTAKMALANIILWYDIKRVPNTPPAVTSKFFGVYNVPDMKYQIMAKPVN